MILKLAAATIACALCVAPVMGADSLPKAKKPEASFCCERPEQNKPEGKKKCPCGSLKETKRNSLLAVRKGIKKDGDTMYAAKPETSEQNSKHIG